MTKAGIPPNKGLMEKEAKEWATGDKPIGLGDSDTQPQRKSQRVGHTKMSMSGDPAVHGRGRHGNLVADK